MQEFGTIFSYIVCAYAIYGIILEVSKLVKDIFVKRKT